MPLYQLLREYEERRQALVDQLKRSPNMDPAVQHQIYGAIKEIEHFIKTLEHHIAASQERGVGIELTRDRPQPLAGRTKQAVDKVKNGTRAIFRERIPATARRLREGTQAYIERRRQRRLLKRQIERELLVRMQHDAISAGRLPGELRTDVRQEPESLPEMPLHGRLEPEFSSTKGTKRDDLEEPRDEMPKRVPTRKGAPLGRHPKRAKPIAHHAKAHQGAHAKSNTGGQHKPHHKGRRFRR